jgi:hypothetical protein
MANKAAGDAIANILIVEALLRNYDFDFIALKRFYKENPSKVFTMAVKNKSAFKTTPDQQRLT